MPDTIAAAMDQFAAPMHEHLALSLEVSPVPLRSAAGAEWKIRLQNDGIEPVRLNFPSAQLGEVVLRRDGVECWRWSDGRLFAQVISERELAPAEAWSFSLEGGTEVEPGRYEATASVCSRPAPRPVSTTLKVEAS